jgi:DNA-binding IclR family transcriptional regulator
VKSAERLLDVLELLARHTRPVPTMAIARDCGIPKSSAHHLLNVMRDRQFVTYYETERAWGLGVAIFEIGSAYLRSAPLQRLGRHLLEELTRLTADTSHLAMLHGTDVLYIDKQQPLGNAASLVTEVGAGSRAILAELPEPQLKALYDGAPLVRRTGRGPGSLAALRRELDEGRERGYALDAEMVTPGITCVAAPVFSHEGVPVAAIGLTFVSAQRSPKQVEEAAAATREIAARLSSNLGYVPQGLERVAV